jgi:hypothetical protein
MKKLVALLALMTFVPAAHADNHEGSAEVSHSGHFRTRYKLNMDADADSNAGPSSEATVYSRFGYAGTFRVDEKLSAHLGLLYASEMGKMTDGVTPTGDKLFVSEAYGNWMATDSLSFKVGRFYLDVANGKVISSNMYEQLPYSLDGMDVSIDTTFASFKVLALKIADNGTSTNYDNDNDVEDNVYGLTADVKNLPDVAKTVHVHVLQRNVDEYDVGGTDQNDAKSELRYGLTVGGEVAGAFYDVTYAMVSGETRNEGVAANTVDLSSNMMDITAGYMLPDIMGLKFWVNYHSDSGDDGTDAGENNDYDSFMYYKHYNAGLMDIMDWGNLTDINVGASLEPMEDLTVKVAYHMFSLTEKQTGTNTVTNPSNVGTLKNDEDALGNEIDLSVYKKYGDNFKIGARYSTMSFGDALQNGTDSLDSASKFWLQAKMMF